MRIGMMIGTAAVLALAAGAVQAQSFDDPKEFEAQRALMSAKAEGPADKPWEQHYGSQMVDTAKYKKPGPYKLCFSNAGVGNPWRVVGFTTMQAEVDVHKADIASFTVADAEGKDDKQISDIKAMLASGNCDALIVSPNTTAALTPAVEEACKQVPVIVFDRGVLTDCPVTVVKPIGGYAFGIAAAEYIAANVPKGGKVLALRILPGVDVLENRWAAAKRIFDEKGIEVVGAEFTDGDRAKTKSIVEDTLTRVGKLDAVWMDAGATSVAAIEAFEDQGMDVPIVTGEDQQDFLQKWKQSGMKAVAPTYPTYQWRTAVIAAVRVLKGEAVPGPAWSLPQPTITAENLDKYVNDKMPPLHYAMCGCEGMPDYPQRWIGK
ncbi:ABC transporter substrate-binding protein [Inquilinus limosus]|uniref:ABC transporter substrate-binding protein n=1 Tax=Inquilinus limosus TaxID=171674 RepID=A0A211ZH11_9PROT|nr:ABC transporter substrate-binding protein [Inquilinus limosus]OWJ64397.1 ABC transporter substrate-binding protein [Inquilinus limosus]